MSLQIKSLVTLVAGAPEKESRVAADEANLIPGVAESGVYPVYTLYRASNESGNKKSAIVKGIRLSNTHTESVAVSLYFNAPPDGMHYTRYALLPEDTLIPPGSTLIDDTELTLGPGDEIQAKAGWPAVIRFLISGVERDVL